MEVPEDKVKRRSFSYVTWQVAEDIVYFLAPMLLADTLGRGLKPLLMDPEDIRGPWECLWHKVGTVTPAYCDSGCLGHKNVQIGHFTVKTMKILYTDVPFQPSLNLFNLIFSDFEYDWNR